MLLSVQIAIFMVLLRVSRLGSITGELLTVVCVDDLQRAGRKLQIT